MADVQVWRDDSRPSLVIEWDNRTIRNQPALSCVLPVFWSGWTVCTLAGTWLLIADGSTHWPSLLMLVIGYIGVIAILFTWALRYTRERIEFINSEYRHYYVRFPWLSPILWPLDTITCIEVGCYVTNLHETDAVATLNVRTRHKRDTVAYWADDGIKQRIFREIHDYLGSIGSTIERRDTLVLDSV